ncbi:hypothetical protein HK405_000591, partial [Cladochytrium tenue]
AFSEHVEAFKRLTLPSATSDGSATSVRVVPVEIRSADQLAAADPDALVLPGGESTAIALVAERSGFLDALRRFIAAGDRPVWGTCAGMILLANSVSAGAKQGGQAVIGGLDVAVHRNAFGRQLDSFLAPLDIVGLDHDNNGDGIVDSGAPSAPFPGVFIRAPAIDLVPPPPATEDALAPAPVTVLARVERGGASYVVAVRQRHIFASAFHPELTSDLRFHAMFARATLRAAVARRQAADASAV